MKNQIYEPHKSSIGGLDANMTALLAYIASIFIIFIPIVRYVAWLAPLIIFFMEKQSTLVKFHAMQSFVLQFAGAVLSFVLSAVMGGFIGIGASNAYIAVAAVGISGILSIITFVISSVIFVFAIIAMISAWKYKEFHIPIAGRIAQKATAKY